MRKRVQAIARAAIEVRELDSIERWHEMFITRGHA
jgi:hypothetical protein